MQDALNSIQNEIEKQQEMVASIRNDMEEVQDIADFEMPEHDEETQAKFEEIVQKKMEETLSAQIEAEDEKRKWLLENVISFYFLILPKAWDKI